MSQVGIVTVIRVLLVATLLIACRVSRDVSPDGSPPRDTGTDPYPNCGNGVVDPGEACDDGNRNPFDDCHSDCQLPGTEMRLDQEYLRSQPVNSKEGATMGIGMWYEMFISDPVDYLFKNTDPRGSLRANVSGWPLPLVGGCRG